MKKYILILLASVVAHVVAAQGFYQDGVPVTADGITFNVKLDKHGWKLSNVENTRTSVATWLYKDGRKIETQEEFERVQFDLYSVNTVAKVINDSFPSTAISALKRLDKCPMYIYYVFDSEGDLLEVSFIMDSIPELLRIPPRNFALLEKNLKKYVKANLNIYAKQMQFVGGAQFVGFKYFDERVAAAENPSIDRPLDPTILGDRDDPIIDDLVPLPPR